MRGTIPAHTYMLIEDAFQTTSTKRRASDVDAQRNPIWENGLMQRQHLTNVAAVAFFPVCRQTSRRFGGLGQRDGHITVCGADG